MAQHSDANTNYHLKGLTMTTTQQPTTAKDYISLIAIGTNGGKKENVKVVFNGLGQVLDEKSNVTNAPGLNLKSSQSSVVTPVFPDAAYKAAVVAKDVTKQQEIADAFSEAVAAAAVANGSSVTEQSSLLDAICEYLDKVEGWSQSDGDHFVYKRSDFNMTEKPLQNGEGRFIAITQQAVFGNK